MYYVIFLAIFLTAFIALQLTIFLFINRKKIYLRGLIGIMISICIYSLFYFFELISPELKYMKLCTSIEYIGILSIPGFWIIMTLEYTNKSKFINKKLYVSLFSLPIILLILNFTNDYHKIFYLNYTASVICSLSIAYIKAGIGYVITVAYINMCFFIGSVLYMLHFIKGSTVYKKRSLIFLITSFLPWSAYFLYVFNILPIKIDLVPISMLMVCIIYTYALFKSDIFETAAIARHIIFDNITEVVLVLDVNNKIIDINKKVEELFHKESNLIIGQDIYTVFNEFKAIKEYLDIDKESSFDFEIEFENKHYYFKGKITYVGDSNKNKGKIIVLSDNTEEVLMIQKLQYYATMDTLTEVYNRNYFHHIINKIVHRNRDKSTALVMFDFDKFKNINDTYGHVAGDEVLKSVLDICKSYLNKNSIIGRYGGEEFIIFLEETDEEKVYDILNGLRLKIMNSNIKYRDEIIKVTCSFGVFISKGLADLEKMVIHADETLYEAKNTGRNKIIIKKNH